MEIGNMNQRISILENHTKVDEIGNHLNVWEEIVSCWAEVKIRNLQSSSEKTDTGVTREIIHWVDSRESSLLRRLERGREIGR